MKKLLVIALALTLALPLAAQTQLTNPDLIKLTKSGLSEDFITDLINQQGSRLSTDASSLVELKTAGVNERILAAAVKKSPSPEKLNSDSIAKLSSAGFSESFILDLMDRQGGSYATDASRLVELRRAGVSERILKAMVGQSGSHELASGSAITIRLIDSIDSQKNNEGDEFRASVQDAVMIGNDTVVPKGADAKVRLVAEKDSGKLTGKTLLSVALVSLTVNGKTVPVSTESVVEASGSQTAKTAKTAGAVGAVGAIIGAIAGGGKGAAIGAATGAAAGAGAQVFMKGERVRVPSETVLTFTTEGVTKLP